MSDERFQSLVERAQQGDATAFAELFAAFEPEVSRLCRRMLGDVASAEDAAAEVFLRARRALDGVDPRRPFRPWLLSVADHYCIDQLRRRATEKRLFDPADFAESEHGASGPSPLAAVEWAERRDALAAAVESLPARYRVPIMLRHFSELDYTAIAEVLGVSRSQVGVLLHRARRALRERLAASSGDRER